MDHLWNWSKAPSLIKLDNILNVNGWKQAFAVLVIGPSILVYISIENKQMHQNDHFIAILS
jgi:hypothetical protein